MSICVWLGHYQQQAKHVLINRPKHDSYTTGARSEARFVINQLCHNGPTSGNGYEAHHIWMFLLANVDDSDGTGTIGNI